MSGCNQRLKNIIFADKKDTPIKIERVIKAEIVYLLKNYFNISAEDVELKLNINSENLYEIQMRGVATQIKNAKIL